MKVSQEQVSRNRERILSEAARLFRERGFDGISVAELMKQAGFTHGGFYGHFSSKEDLKAQACACSFAEKVSVWNKERKLNPDRPLESAAAYYLTRSHRDNPGTGCPLATSAVDVSRQSQPVQRAFTKGFRSLVSYLASKLPGKSKIRKRKKALSAWSMLVGAMVLARAVDDPKLSDEILESVSELIKKL